MSLSFALSNLFTEVSHGLCVEVTVLFLVFLSVEVRPGTHERHLPSRHRSGVVAASVAMNWHSVHTSDKCPATPQRHRRSRIFLQLVSVYFRVSTMSLSKSKRVAVAYLAYEHLYRPVKKRKYWTHPLVSARLLKGAFSTLFEDLKEDPPKFFNYFRMSIRSFNELAAKLEDTLKMQNTVIHKH